MPLRLLIAGALICAAPTAIAQQRQLDAHEHGAGTLDLARSGNILEFELRAPGADIVGFEHAATSEEDKMAVAAAIEMLSKPETILALSDAAGCEPQEATAILVAMSDEHEDEAGMLEHDEHDEHDDHEEAAAGHTEFHAHAIYTCSNPEALDRIDLPYFGHFPNARELEVQAVSDKGGFGAEVVRDQPVLQLDGKL
ncbi:DUF2796 domain-containing protein [Tropicimonas sediminicola]|uniref:DUF2796 domain-containing protein n=1 Tax=Tropicimonas sediminicola TaxID=1031541 RepID=A0A239II69_9RHOB|nr:DUF2796 domain-containing protein [Tropicimonas sediminicola]SNS93317.1 Protein of unknown function [Tropicimonas sediminicola]